MADLKKILSFMLAALMCLLLLSPALGEDRVVLTIGDFGDRSSFYKEGEDRLGLLAYLEDTLGVDIRYIHMSTDEYTSALSSGDLPDIVATWNNLSTILENGVALDLDPYLEEYCPNFMQGASRMAYDVFKQLGNEGDGFYFFPIRIGYNGVGFSNGTARTGCYIVRWDYYKELGYPPINNEDDYLDVLLRMHELHPFTEDGDPTYLFGTENFKGYATAFRSEVSLDYWAAYKYQNNIFTNEIFDGYTDPEHSMWWTSMEWYNKLYRAGKDNGSFDLEIFTQTSEQFDDKCLRGQYLGLHNAKSSLYNSKVRTDPDTLTGYAMVPSPGTNLYTNVYQLLGNGSAYMWFISANSPHKEEALKLFNCMCDPDFLREICLGRKGVTWDYDQDGVPRMTEYGREQLDAYKSGKYSPDNYYAQWGSFGSLPNNWPVLRDNVTHPDGYLIDFATVSREYEISSMTNNLALDICEHYGTELPSDAFYNAGGLDYRNDCGEAISSSISSLNSEQLHILEEAEEILDYVRVDLVLAETDEAWNAIRDETLRELEALGEPEVFRAYKEKWDAAAAVIVPMVRQVQIANGIEPYTPEQYERYPETETEEQQP